MPVEPNSGSYHLLTGEPAVSIRAGMYVSFEEAFTAAEKSIKPHDGTHVGTIVLLDDGSVEVVTTNHSPGSTTS